VDCLKDVKLYTDGACSGNPGPGGWGSILEYGGREKTLSGYMRETTNNRMEIFAVVQGLRALREPCRVTVYSDSAYLVDAFTKGWVRNWQSNGWKTAGGDPVENQDLWRQLLMVMKPHDVSWIRVRGHSDHEYNNRCDKLATDQIKKHRKTEKKTEPSKSEEAGSGGTAVPGTE
jgi:ribonuclease HI